MPIASGTLTVADGGFIITIAARAVTIVTNATAVVDYIAVVATIAAASITSVQQRSPPLAERTTILTGLLQWFTLHHNLAHTEHRQQRQSQHISQHY